MQGHTEKEEAIVEPRVSGGSGARANARAPSAEENTPISNMALAGTKGRLALARQLRESLPLDLLQPRIQAGSE